MEDDVGSARTLAPEGTLTAGDGRDPTLPRDPSFERAAGAPTEIGRYQVLRRLGAGGMGVVYAAHDPELDRTVAIKVVGERLAGAPGFEERLRREAQALARLSHPNVVSVFDAGIADQRLYIVMQFVDGTSLDVWLEQQRPDPGRVLACFLQAGRGLAAAHAAGLVHRDFKPGNVLVERDGTVRVSDFGLARLSHLADPPSGVGGASAVGHSLTSGEVIGTPAYMAPEQLSGETVTAAADQFSFCVSLWGALAGKRPFRGDTLDTLRGAITRGAIDPPARALPRRIERALRRGLAARVADRFPDMSALLAALAPPRRRWLGVAAGVVVLAAAGVVALSLRGGAAPNPCRGVAGAVDETWTPARSTRVHDAVAGFGSPDAAAVADAVVATLDDRAATWRTMRLDTCAASQVRHDEPAETTTRRLACLDQSLHALGAAIDLLSGDPSPAQLAGAPAIARTGVDPSDCTAAGALEAPAVADLTPALASRLAELDARSTAGDDAFVIANAPALADELERAGDLDAAARAWFQIAKIGRALSNQTAREDMRKAATLAQRGGDPDLSAVAWGRAAKLAAQGNAEPGDVDDLLAMASAAASASGNPKARMEVDTDRGFILSYRRQGDQAVALCQRVYDDAKAAYGAISRPLVGALGCLFHADYHLERWDETRRIADERLAACRVLDGPDSPTCIDEAEDRSLAVFHVGDHAAGRAQMADVIAALGRLYGAVSARVLTAWWELARVESDDGVVATPEAMAASQHAVDIAGQVLPDTDIKRAQVTELQASLLAASGDHDGAAAAYDRALAIYDRGADRAAWANTAYNDATDQINAGHCDRAAPLLDRIDQLGAAAENPTLAPTARAARGVCRIKGGSYPAGVAQLAAAIHDLDGLGATDFADDYRLELADAELTHGDRAAARALAAKVKAGVSSNSPGHQLLRDRADAILKR